MSKVIKEILIERDGMTESDSDSLIEEAREVMNDYLAQGEVDYAYDICMDYFGLEPDYIVELID